jgi:hypothetical protein
VRPAGIVTHEDFITVTDFLAVDAENLREAAVGLTQPEKSSMQGAVEDTDRVIS